MIPTDLLSILAQDKTDAPAFLDLLRNPMVLLIVMLVVFYIFVIRSKQKEERSRREMLNQIKKGDKVQTIGGIIGVVLEAKETEVVLKVDESTNTRMRFVRSAIHRVIDEERPAEKTDKK
jgi:preprotein translocase subunit YajC